MAYARNAQSPKVAAGRDAEPAVPSAAMPRGGSRMCDTTRAPSDRTDEMIAMSVAAIAAIIVRIAAAAHALVGYTASGWTVIVGALVAGGANPGIQPAGMAQQATPHASQ